MFYREFSSPVGELLLLSDGQFLTHLLMDGPVPEGAVPGENVVVLEKTADWEFVRAWEVMLKVI